MLSSFFAFLCSIGFLSESLCSAPPPPEPQPQLVERPNNTEKEDDWVLESYETTSDSTSFGGRVKNTLQQKVAPMMAMESMAPMAGGMNKSLGFAVGGAKDINNFRENIENGYLPLPTDITYEGVYYDYFFDTGENDKCETLFCPSYAPAITADPFSGENEYYVSVGLNSNLTEADFERKKLNLMVVLDISGSMGSPFDEYYYDNPAKHDSEIDREDRNKTKMELANEAIIALTEHLRDDDRFGMVVFDDQAYQAKPMNLVGNTDMQAIRDHIADITDHGGTNMEAGYEKGTERLQDLDNVNPEEYETRIIFLTDAMPNTGNIDENSLFGMMEKNARQRVYTSFVGIGLDFNTELIADITKVRGANYFSVHNANEFKKLLDDDFEYMVTPLVFDLTLRLESDDVAIERVFGSPEADEATGQIMKINTLFPSRTEDGEVKGGIVLLKLDQNPTGKDIALTVNYEDRSGKRTEVSERIHFDEKEAEYFGHNGIRKAVALTRYVNLMKNWLLETYYNFPQTEKPYPPQYEFPPIACPTREIRERGLCVPPIMPPMPPHLGRWERESQPLLVSRSDIQLFGEFLDYFEDKIETIGDETMKQEINVLHEILKSSVHSDLESDDGPNSSNHEKQDDWEW